ncbi:Ig-like domain repeat protein [Enterococcus mundtii]|nr:Ig-like domain repeat protein [Enterococcus mundtii]
MKTKKIRIMAASFLLFQHALMPSVALAIENEATASTEIMEEQPESHLLEEVPEAVAEQEPIIQEEPDLVAEIPEAPPEVAEEVPPMEATPEEPATGETIETLETQEEVPPLDESPLSNHLGRLNLTAQNVAELTNHGRSSYIQAVLQNAINRTITLNNAVDATADFSVTVPTHSMVQRQGTSNGWISSIVTDSSVGMPDELYTQMYYGNHSTHRNTYTLTNITSNRSDVTVTGTVTINSNFTATINFTLRRVQTSNSTAPVEIRGNVGLGTTGVATQFTNIATPRHVMNLSYNNETIGSLTIDDGRSPAVIGTNITIQAQRAPVTMSEDEIRSWFTRLPDNPDNYEYSVASPAEGWRPGTTGDMIVTLRNKTTAVTETHTTNYQVVDTQAPVGRVRAYSVTDIQARRSGGSVAIDRANFAMALTELSDNWTLTEDINIAFRNLVGDVMSTFTGIAPNPNRFYMGRLTFEDEAGNISAPVGVPGGGGSETIVQYRVVDTQAPTANFNNAVVDLAARRSGNPSRNELMPFLNGNPEDNWSLPENIQLQLVNSNGSTLNLHEIAPSTQIQTGYIRLRDEAGNQTSLQEVRFRVIDNEAPTANVTTDIVSLEARRQGELSTSEISSFLVGDPSDNWSTTENITVELLDSASEKLDITNTPPSTSELSATIRLTDQAGNTREYPVRYQVVDTQAPTAIFKEETIDFSNHNSNSFSRNDLLRFLTGDPSDNWTLPTNIKIELVDENDNEFNLNELDLEEHTGYLYLEDEIGNRSKVQEVRFLAGDNEAPTGNIVTTPIDFQARRMNELTRDDLLRFFTEDPLDNVTASDQIDISLRNSLGNVISIVNVAPSDTVYEADVRLQDQAGNRTEYPVNYRVVDTQAPTGSRKTSWTILEANRHRNFTQEEMRLVFNQLEDNWSTLENIRLQADRNLAGMSPNVVNAFYPTTITARDEAGNESTFTQTMIRIEDRTAPTANFKDEVIDFSTLTSNTFSRTDLLKFFNGDPDDNWSLPENITIELVDNEGNTFELDDLEYQEYTGFIRLEDQHGNRTDLQEVRFLAGDNEGPTGNVVTTPVDFQARRVNELTRDDLLRFFTEDPLDNTTPTDQIDISLRNHAGNVVSIVNVAPSTTVYDANVRLQDIRGNFTEHPVNYRVIDTQAPTGGVKDTWTVFEATRERDFTQEELRSLLTNLEDNWTEVENLTLRADRYLYNAAPNTGSSFYPTEVFATDEAGNTRRFSSTRVRINDTTPPDGVLKDPLVFTKGQTEPNAREFLDGEPTDNWTLSADIQVAVTYENNVSFADLEVGTYGVTVTLTDQARNSRTLNSQVTILEDTSEYIDVTIPMNVSFAQSKESNGIVSPTYQIQNNAERAVQVSVSSVVSQSNTGQLTEIDLGVKNNLNDNQVMLISSGQTLNNRRELGTIEGQNTSFSFSLFGTVGENFDFESLDDPLNPVYSMRLNFNAK